MSVRHKPWFKVGQQVLADGKGVGRIIEVIERERPGYGAGRRRMSAPPMPEGFTDRSAWDAIHWRFGSGSLLDQCVIDWQRDNQARVKAAVAAASSAGRRKETG